MPLNMFNYLHKAQQYTPHRDNRAGILSRQIKDIKRGNMPLKHVVQLSSQGPAIYPSQGQPSWDLQSPNVKPSIVMREHVLTTHSIWYNKGPDTPNRDNRAWILSC
jgi:hypothetical protein